MAGILPLHRRLYFTPLFFFVTITLSVHSYGQRFRYTKTDAVIKKDSISSKILNENRRIQIYRSTIFPEYANTVPPVIYVLEGDAYTRYFVTIVNYLSERLVHMPPIAVVGIENSDLPGGRDRDFTLPIGDDTANAKNRGADKFIRYLREEVMPLVEKDYKTQPYRIVTGHSSSGDLVVHAFLNYPKLFNAYLAVDVSFSFEDAYLNFADSVINSLSEINNTFFLGSGGVFWAQPYTRKLDSMFQRKKVKGLSYKYIHYPYESHFDVFLKAYYDGFRFIFEMDVPPENMPPSQVSYQIFEDQYNKMSKIFGYKMKPREGVMADYGLHFLNDWNNVNKALEFLKWNVENYPASSYSYNNYAEALLKKGDKKNAILNYEKAYQLDSTNTTARDKAQKLKNQ